MKKMFAVMIVIAMAVAACGKKAAPVAPKQDTGSGTPAAPAGDGSAAPAGGDAPPPASM
jgi:predicted small lipoprotein YifL